MDYVVVVEVAVLISDMRTDCCSARGMGRDGKFSISLILTSF